MTSDKYQRQRCAMRHLSNAYNRLIACERSDIDSDTNKARRWVSAWEKVVGTLRPHPTNDDAIVDFNPLFPPGRWLARQFLNQTGNFTQADHFPAEVSPERCAELATQDRLEIEEWIELTGVGIGAYGDYQVTETSVSFIKWTTEQIGSSPVDWQQAMVADNRSGLEFPCTPVTLAIFVSSAIGHNQFSVPKEFLDSVLLTEKASSQEFSKCVADSQLEVEARVADDYGDEKPKRRQRTSPNKALILSIVDKGIPMNIERIWLYIIENRGMPGFLIAAASRESATTHDGERFTKKGLARTLENLHKKTS